MGYNTTGHDDDMTYPMNAEADMSVHIFRNYISTHPTIPIPTHIPICKSDIACTIRFFNLHGTTAVAHKTNNLQPLSFDSYSFFV